MSRLSAACFLIAIASVAAAGTTPESERPGVGAAAIDSSHPLHGCLACFCTLIECLPEPDRGKMNTLKAAGCIRFLTTPEYETWAEATPPPTEFATTDFGEGLITVNCGTFQGLTEISATQWQKKWVVFEEAYHYVHQLSAHVNSAAYHTWLGDHLSRPFKDIPSEAPFPKGTSVRDAWELYEEVQAKRAVLDSLLDAAFLKGELGSPAFVEAYLDLIFNMWVYTVDMCARLEFYESRGWPTTPQNVLAWERMKTCKKSAMDLIHASLWEN